MSTCLILIDSEASTDGCLVSGLSAAHTIYQAGGNVVVLDKQGFFGGNSTKVSCDELAAMRTIA